MNPSPSRLLPVALVLCACHALPPTTSPRAHAESAVPEDPGAGRPPVAWPRAFTSSSVWDPAERDSSACPDHTCSLRWQWQSFVSPAGDLVPYEETQLPGTPRMGPDLIALELDPKTGRLVLVKEPDLGMDARGIRIRPDTTAPREHPKERIIWETTLGRDSDDDGNVAVAAGVAFVSRFSSTGAGARVYAVYLRSGEVAWESELAPLGEPGAMAGGYTNAIQLVARRGVRRYRELTVYRRESGGAAVDALDSESGERLGHSRFPPIRDEGTDDFDGIERADHPRQIEGRLATAVRGSQDTLEYEVQAGRLCRRTRGAEDVWCERVEVSYDPIEIVDLGESIAIVSSEGITIETGGLSRRSRFKHRTHNIGWLHLFTRAGAPIGRPLELGYFGEMSMQDVDIDIQRDGHELLVRAVSKPGDRVLPSAWWRVDRAGAVLASRTFWSKRSTHHRFWAPLD